MPIEARPVGSSAMQNRTEPSEPRIDLPDDLAAATAAATGMDERPETLAELLSRVDERVASGGHAVRVSDMYVERETRHEVHHDGEVHHTPCVLDALLAAVLASDPVTVRSTDPVTGGDVTFDVDDEALDATPAAAVVSFGLAADLPEPDGDTLFDDWLGRDDGPAVGYVCPYINAFESRESYREWLATTDAVATPLTVPEAEALARRVAAGPMFG